VLELGVGGGRVAKRTACLVAEVHAVDISSEMLKKA
jgi:ubiquinone/menaquinone biosynthesis C-methylase UbiE